LADADVDAADADDAAAGANAPLPGAKATYIGSLSNAYVKHAVKLRTRCGLSCS
jgi:hypothetical protein